MPPPEQPTEARPVVLRGTDHEALAPVGSSDEKALSLFKGLLYNTPEERTDLSNAIHLWDLIPKYSGERFNNADEMPTSHECEFDVAGERLVMTLLPGAFFVKCRKTQKRVAVRRYPGGREQAVEQALIKIACDQAQMQVVEGQTVFQVSFSIRHLINVLASLGSSLNHTQVKQSLEVLSTSIMTVSDVRQRTVQGSAILPGFVCHNDDTNATSSPNSQWAVNLHALIAHAIRNATYRQYDVSRFAGQRAYGVYLLRQLILNATNISPEYPHRVRFTELQRLSSGLNYKRARDGIDYLEREIKRMVKSGCLAEYTKHTEYSRGKGRPAIIDAVFTLYPSDSLIKEVKRSSRRLTYVEQNLQLPRSQRQQRQIALPLE